MNAMCCGGSMSFAVRKEKRRQDAGATGAATNGAWWRLLLRSFAALRMTAVLVDPDC
jgi:hypothetical protein